MNLDHDFYNFIKLENGTHPPQLEIPIRFFSLSIFEAFTYTFYFCVFAKSTKDQIVGSALPAVSATLDTLQSQLVEFIFTCPCYPELGTAQARLVSLIDHLSAYSINIVSITLTTNLRYLSR